MNLVRRFTVYISGENKKLKFPSSGNFVVNFFSFFCCFSFSSFSDHGDHGFQEENCRLVHGGLNQVVEWMQCNALQLILLEGGDRTNLKSNFMTNLLFVISFSSKNKYSRILHAFMPYTQYADSFFS